MARSSSGLGLNAMVPTNTLGVGSDSSVGPTAASGVFLRESTPKFGVQ